MPSGQAGPRDESGASSTLPTGAVPPATSADDGQSAGRLSKQPTPQHTPAERPASGDEEDARSAAAALPLPPAHVDAAGSRRDSAPTPTENSKEDLDAEILEDTGSAHLAAAEEAAEEQVPGTDTESPRSRPLPVAGDREAACTYETQRWFPVLGWGKKRLPTDCPEWIDRKRKARPREEVRLPPGCRWDSEWAIDYAACPADPEGWEYAGDWWWTYHCPKRTGDCVRRRRWVRYYVRIDVQSFEGALVKGRSYGGASGGEDELDLTAVLRGEPAASRSAAGTRGSGTEFSDASPRGVPQTPVSPRTGESSREKDVRKACPELPAEDKVIADYQCSYKASNKIDRLGRMWITSEHICFASPLLSPSIMWNFRDVTDLFKKKDLLVLQAITICVKEVEYTFTAFVHRDAAFSALCEQWFASLRREGRDPEAVRAAAEEARERRREQRKSRRKTVTGAAAPPRGSPTAAVRDGPASVPASPSLRAVSPGAAASAPVPDPAPEMTAGAGAPDMPALFAGTPLAGGFVDEVTVLESKETKRVHPPHMLPQGASLGHVWAALLRDGSDFLGEYHHRGGRYEGAKESPQRVSMPQWEGGQTSRGWREFTCTTVVSAPFSTHTRYIERQRYALFSGPPRVLLFHTVSQTPEIMTGDSFRIEVLVSIKEVAERQCEVTADALVHFLKSTWLKGKITNAAHTELTAAYAGFVKQAHAAVAAYIGGGAAPAEPAAAEAGAAAPAAAAPGLPGAPAAPPAAASAELAPVDAVLRVLCLLMLLWALWSAWGAVSATSAAAQHFADVAAAVAGAARCREVPGCDGTKAAAALADMLRGDAAGAAAGAAAVVSAQWSLGVLMVLCLAAAAAAGAAVCWR